MSLETVGWEDAKWECGECDAADMMKNQTLSEHYRKEHPEVLSNGS